MFSAFHSEEEWRIIINEADPNSTDDGLTVGLGNIHIFALANVLKRPIILLDSPQVIFVSLLVAMIVSLL